MRVIFRHFARASRYFASVSGPHFTARSKISWAKNGISRARSFSFHAMRSASDFTGAFGPSEAKYAASPSLNS